jgi:GNAT superfamily N-acetyltransferase
VTADFWIRPMRTADVVGVERLSAESFYDLDMRTQRADLPPPERRSEAKAVNWRRRTQHMLDHDAGGCWVAEDASGLVGAVAAIKRDLTWILAAYMVRPGVQGRGIGKQLLEASMTHGRNCLRGMLASSVDPAAVRRYLLAGFTMHPTMFLGGRVARQSLPIVERVREGSQGDIDLCDSVDRQVRDAAHGVDHQVLTAIYRLLVVDRTTGTGYAYVEPGGGPYLLAATNRRTATDLLWETLAASDPDSMTYISHLTEGNAWAIEVGTEARMALGTHGYLALRGMKPPMPYIPSGHFL